MRTGWVRKTELTLHRLRHEQAAVGQPLRCRSHPCGSSIVPAADAAAGAFFLASWL
jgi:hypothetical protein